MDGYGLAAVLPASPASPLYNTGLAEKYDKYGMDNCLAAFANANVKDHDNDGKLEYVVTGCAPRLGTFQRPSREHYEQGMAALEKMGIAHLAHACYTQISGGERQQVSIARALAQRAALILMDEPTAHLDYGNQMKVLRTVCALAGEGYAVALTTHNPDHALLLDDQVAVLDRSGRFTCGPCTQIMTEPFLQALYGLPLTLCYVPQAGRPACVAPKLE